MMTREEAIALLNDQYETCKRIYDCSADQRKSYPNVPQFMEALGMALTALRPVSWEPLEKVWRGEWVKCKHADYYVCNKCSTVSKTGENDFCKSCGRAMTDEAMDMVMERLNKMEEMKK